MESQSDTRSLGASMIDWDDLMRREGSAVWRTAYHVLRNKADADECFQETFLAALELSNRQPVGNWPALLQRLAASRAIDRLRKRLRRSRHEEITDFAQTEGDAHDPSQRAEAMELAGALRWALAQLSRQQAEVFCLHELGDWSSQQIADQLGITANSVGVILHRARQKLQQLLKMQNRLSAALEQQRPK
jgi:RNA polymerase sigma-70 factor (ECF subfamily)